MWQATCTAEPLYSTFGDDPDLGDLVEMFVTEMPDRTRLLRAYYEQSNWEQLGRLAHQLKGAAGSYGFDQVTPVAARLESSVRGALPESQILHDLEELLQVCERLRAGAPGRS